MSARSAVSESCVLRLSAIATASSSSSNGGGHFPASEVPDLYVADVRTYFSAYQQAQVR